MATIIDGKAVSAAVKERVKNQIEELKEKNGVQAGLAVVLVGEDPASKVYVRNKKLACEATGIRSFEYYLPEETTQQQLLDLIDTLNQDKAVNGILVQMPLPKHIDEMTITCAIDPLKDVDAFHPENVGRIMMGIPEFLPCTPAGVMELIKSVGIEVSGKNCVVIGRSNIVGKPQAMLLLKENGTVTICHSRTKNLSEVTKQADILVVAIGKAKFVTADMVKPGAVVIDVGMDRDENGKLCGDVDFSSTLSCRKI